MTTRISVVAAVCAITLAACRAHSPQAAHDDHAEQPHWSYSGANGPAAWGSLDESFATCSHGASQSPIDIANATPDPALPLLRVEYGPSRASVANNGHTLQATFDHGGTLNLGDQSYRLLQVHHHRLSEHTINGKAAEVELHLVHRAGDGRLAVIGVLLDEGNAHNSFVAALIEGGRPAQPVMNPALDPATILPADLSYATYSGSLTTPPCTEGVRWIVLHSRGSVSTGQLEQLDAILPRNARPVMPLGTRRVLTRDAAR